MQNPRWIGIHRQRVPLRPRVVIVHAINARFLPALAPFRLDGGGIIAIPMNPGLRCLLSHLSNRPFTLAIVPNRSREQKTASHPKTGTKGRQLWRRAFRGTTLVDWRAAMRRWWS